MRVNRYNLEIAKHCASKPAPSGERCDLFHFTETGTMAIAKGAIYAINVSALEIQPSDIPCSLDKNSFSQNTYDIDLQSRSKGSPSPPKLPQPTGDPLHEITIDSKYLKALAGAADGFGPIRIRFYGANKPISFNAVIPDTGQKWEALLMPRYAHVDDERFIKDDRTGHKINCPVNEGYPLETCECENDLDKAIRLAKEMMGK